jgi:stearoyl-CoA desaturase (delta-9 desaturase)
VADEKTLEALIANRYELMATYAKDMRLAARVELAAMRARSADAAVLKAAKRWMHRDVEKVPAHAVTELAKARAASPMLDKMVTMREELRQMWLNTSVSREQLALELQLWCRRAEESGIAALREFSLRLRAAHV